MHNALITVTKIWPKFAGSKSKNIKIEDAEGGSWKIGESLAGTLQEGRLYKVSYTEESFQGNAYKQIKAVQTAGGETIAPTNGAAKPHQNGAEKGMWEKLAFEAYLRGDTEKRIYAAAKFAREFAQCQLLNMDGPPEAKPASAGTFPSSEGLPDYKEDEDSEGWLK